MREIIFRGKRTDNDEWAYGNFVMDATEQVQREHIPLDPILADGFIRRYDLAQLKIVMHEVDRKTVGQYTGLTDKNGKRIFEGDILRKLPDSLTKYSGITDHIFTVEWCCDCGMWVLPCITNEIIETDFTVFNGYDFEIIGNIHDNPELLESGCFKNGNNH